MGDKCKIMRPKHHKRVKKSVKQKRDKCKNHAAKAPTGDWRQWGTSGRQMGDVKSCGQSTHKRVETVGDTATRNASPETNVKSWGPVMDPFQRSKNPSQVNLFGELDTIIRGPLYSRDVEIGTISGPSSKSRPLCHSGKPRGTKKITKTNQRKQCFKWANTQPTSVRLSGSRWPRSLRGWRPSARPPRSLASSHPEGRRRRRRRTTEGPTRPADMTSGIQSGQWFPHSC